MRGIGCLWKIQQSLGYCQFLPSSEHLSCFCLNQLIMSLATSLRSSSWRTSTNSFRVVHLKLHNFSIKSLIALTPGFLLSVSNSWMSCLEISNLWATCLQFFWTGEESESSCRIKSSTSYGKSASLKSNITKGQSRKLGRKKKRNHNYHHYHHHNNAHLRTPLVEVAW